MLNKKLTTFGKITVILSMTLIIVFAIFGFVTIFNMNNVNGDTKTEYLEVKVQPGDTLWSIAESNCSNNTDLRDYIYEICETNDTNANNLLPGQILHIPVE